MSSASQRKSSSSQEGTPDDDTANTFSQLLATAGELPSPTPHPGGPVRIEQGRGIVFSAPHQAVHIRDGARLPSEFGSAELAFALARSVNGSAVCTADPQSGDPNWDVGHPYCDTVSQLAHGDPVLDFHKMKPRGIDMCVGLGPHRKLAERLLEPLLEEAVRAGLRVAVNWPFAAGPVTVTGQLQERGLEVAQVELAFGCYDPGPTKAAAWSALLRAVRRILAERS